MRKTKIAKEIQPGDKIFLEDSPNSPRVVKASYVLGSRQALEVEGVSMILQVEPDAPVTIWTN